MSVFAPAGGPDHPATTVKGMDATAAVIHDVDEAGFGAQVIERSKQLPVVVDFWAEWCGPCRQLTPALEQAAGARPGKVELAKVDTDQNQGLAQRYGIQGIPAVKAFRNGEVASEFTGAIPPAEVERFFNTLVPSEADELTAAGDEASLRRALELDARHTGARRELGRMLLLRGDSDEAAELLEGIAGDFVAEGLAARAAARRARRGIRGLGRGRSRAGAGAAPGGHRRRAGRRAPRPPACRDGGDLHRARARQRARSHPSPPPGRDSVRAPCRRWRATGAAEPSPRPGPSGRPWLSPAAVARTGPARR